LISDFTSRDDEKSVITVSRSEKQSRTISDLKMEHETFFNHEISKDEPMRLPPRHNKIKGVKAPFYRLKYSDVWKIHAAKYYTDRQNKRGAQIIVLQNDVVRLQDKIPIRMLGPNWDGSDKPL